MSGQFMRKLRTGTVIKFVARLRVVPRDWVSDSPGVGAASSYERLAMTAGLMQARGRGLSSATAPLPAPPACAFYARSVPECSAIARGREGAGRSAPDELQRAEEGVRLSVCVSAYAHHMLALCLCMPRTPCRVETIE